jgi:hypothetical protein
MPTCATMPGFSSASFYPLNHFPGVGHLSRMNFTATQVLMISSLWSTAHIHSTVS